MARKRFTPEQIIAILREADAGDAKEVIRKHNITDTTFYRWRRMYGGMQTSEVQRVRQLEKENSQLKQLAGDQALAIQVMKEELKKRGWI
ncbi:MAG: transposase [Elusimicrobia bacterium]|nr:transposase [Elusimicrobiota bacterium]